MLTIVIMMNMLTRSHGALHLSCQIPTPPVVVSPAQVPGFRVPGSRGWGSGVPGFQLKFPGFSSSVLLVLLVLQSFVFVFYNVALIEYRLYRVVFLTRLRNSYGKEREKRNFSLVVRK